MEPTADSRRVLELLRRAFEGEPTLSLTARAAALDEADALLARSASIAVPDRLAWQLEVAAERAVDEARLNRLESAHRIADQVLATPQIDTVAPVAAARALEARARAWAWSGTDRGVARADRLFADVADRYAALGATEWQGFVTFWWAFMIQQSSDGWDRAHALMVEALAILAPDSPRRSTVISFFADLLVATGRFDEADSAVAEGISLADKGDDAKTRGYLQWTAAKLASARGDRLATERHLREVEREGGEWLSHHGGVSFFADAAELLDRVGLDGPARAFLARAVAADPSDDTCRQAVATVAARSGDPAAGLAHLQDLMAGEWFDKSLMWRHVALHAWCQVRLGNDGAARLAARAFDLASGGVGVQAALLNEPELMTALLPLAADAGSAVARERLCADRTLMVRLLGTFEVVRADGTAINLPTGKPADLVKLLALRPRGASVEEVIDALFPDATLAAGRNRLRQVLHRLRSTSGPVVTRDDDRLRLVPAWVDAAEFLAAADRALTSSGVLAMRQAHAALAVWNGRTGVDLDPYTSWTPEVLNVIRHRRLALLDLIADDAVSRGSALEAVAALRTGITHDPDEPDRRARLAEQLTRLGQHAAAAQLRTDAPDQP